MGEKKKMKKALNAQILDATGQWKTPFSNDSLSDARLAILGRIRTEGPTSPPLETVPGKGKPPLVRKMNQLSWLKVAAGLALLVAIPFLISILGNVKVANKTSESQWVELPDDSRVLLGAGANVKYNEWIWPLNRRLDFHGEAYFEVIPGSDFTVNTMAGEIAVLGTTFSIWADERNLLVHCNTGRVMVSFEGHEQVLSANEFTRRQNTGTLTGPQMLQHEGAFLPKTDHVTMYDSAPIGVVLEQIRKSTGLQIHSELEESLRYSGTLNVNDVNECFQLLCKPFGATYTIDAGGTVTIKP